MVPFVKDDVRRVTALRELRLLDTPAHPNFDRLTHHCAELLNCPFSMLTLVDEGRQWFLSSHGFAVKETSREDSFCNYVVASGTALKVESARDDSRFSENPFVRGEPYLRSYLGYPVRGPKGDLLGALCVADIRTRTFGAADFAHLEFLAAIVEDLIRAHSEGLVAARLNRLLRNETRALTKSSQLLKQAEKVGRIGAWELSLEAQSLRFSDQMYALSGLRPNEEIDTRRALDFYAPEDRPRIEKAIRRAAIDGDPFDYEADFLPADGSVRRIRCFGERLDGDKGSSPRVVGVVQDISDVYRANLALKRAADYDSLTGVYNRHAFDKNLHQKIQEHRRTGQKLSLILLDLDGFKDINDTFGHVVGDLVLEEISARVRKAIDESTILARWGGDEFALLPPLGSSLVEVTALAETVLRAIGSQVDISGQKLQLSGTAGIGWFQEGMAARELIRQADLALYEGKKRERSAVHYYHPRLELQNQTRQRAIAEVRAALDDKRVFAAYQPIIDLSDGCLIGFESLMRINARGEGRLTATDVLPALLDPVLSRDITEAMLQSVCRDMGFLMKNRSDLNFISLNVVEADLLSRGFGHKLLHSLAAAGIRGQQLTLEITETMLLVNDNAVVRDVLTQLHNAGIAIALDDFGTGFSSLSHLRDFPIDKVKIDCSFVQAMTNDWQARAIVQALIAMAKNMNIQVIAEGIETEQQRQLLQQMGCAFGQGFLFSPAMEPGALILENFGYAQSQYDKERSAA